MKFESDAWVNRWSRPTRKRITGISLHGGCGSEDARSDLWCASLCATFGNRFRDGVSILDYGCGCCRLMNFVSGFLERFQYSGFEMNTEHGRKCIDIARRHLGADPRGRFGLIDEKTVDDGLSTADVVVFGSVFTHLRFAELESMVVRLRPLFLRGGAAVLSVFMADQERLVGEGEDMYGVKGCVYQSHYTRNAIKKMFARHSVNWCVADEYNDGPLVHSILRVERG